MGWDQGLEIRAGLDVCEVCRLCGYRDIEGIEPGEGVGEVGLITIENDVTGAGLDRVIADLYGRAGVAVVEHEEIIAAVVDIDEVAADFEGGDPPERG